MIPRALPFVIAAAVASLLAAPALAKPAKTRPATAADIVAAERAFAADGYANGIKPSFLRSVAPEAIGFEPDPVNSLESLKTQPDAKPDDPKLEWWPLWAGIASSGDLGFTSGPYSYGGKRKGYYFTVWARQADGKWKWIFDGGTPSDAAGAPGPGGAVAYLTTATAGSPSPKAALADVASAEATLAETARTDLTAAYQAVLEPGSRLQGSPAPPATEPKGFEAELDWRGTAMTFTPLGSRASRAGDLAWTYGDAAWTKDGKPAKGHYVRIWQKRADGWRLMFDELLVTGA